MLYRRTNERLHQLKSGCSPSQDWAGERQISGKQNFNPQEFFHLLRPGKRRPGRLLFRKQFLCATTTTSFLNHTRPSGGMETVFKNSFKCVELSFLQGPFLKQARSSTDPSKYNKEFIHDLTDFLAEIMPHGDKVLIVGHFNIHVCCPDKALVKEFLSIIDS